MLINFGDVVTGALVNAIAVVGRRISMTMTELRTPDGGLSTARWFETFRLTESLPELPDLPLAHEEQFTAVLSGAEVQAALQELLAVRLTDAPETDASRARDATRTALASVRQDMAGFDGALVDYYDDQICTLVARLEAEEPPLLAQIRSEAFSSRMISILHAIERNTAATDGKYVIPISGSQGMQAGDHNTQVIFIGERPVEPSSEVVGAGVPESSDVKRVRDFPNPIALGVHPAADRYGAAVSSQLDRVPPYAPREFDGDLRSLLRSSGFVLLTGPSTAGKSRAAYEAVRTVVPNHRLLVPGDRKDLLPTLSYMLREPECVLWLDDLERFIGADGLTHNAVAHALIGQEHHRIIMATMRDGALNQYQAGNSDDTGGQIGRNVRRVLEQAQKIRVDPFLSTTERAEADKLSDPRIREALTHAGTYGLAEYLAAGPELLARYSEAWGGGNPVGAALVAAAVDCRRAGLTKAAPKELLEELRFTYLGKSGRDRLRREDLAVAWAWATNGSDAGIPLLLEVHDSAYVVFDYLVDHAQGNRTAESNVPREVLGRILLDADAGEAQMIGWTARSQGYDDVTCRAFAQSYKALIASLGADHPQTLYAQASVAYAKYCLGHWKEAMSALQAVIARSTRVLGSRDPLTLSSRIDLTYLLTDTRRLHEAEAEFKSILKVLSADDDQYITAQNGLAITYLESGQPELAERQFQEVITAMAGRYGPDNRGTLTPRCYRALAIERQGRLDEAEYEQRTVLRELEAAYGEEYMVTLQSRSNLAEVLRKQGRLIESEQEYTSVLEVRTNVFGEDHPATLGGAACLAAVIAEQGRLAEAKAVYGALISGYCRTFGRQHQETIKVRQELAATLRKMGKLSEANKQYVRILKAQEGTLGADHEDALATRQIIDSLAN